MSNKNDDKMNKRKQNNCNGKNCHRNNKNNKNYRNKNNQSDKKKIISCLKVYGTHSQYHFCTQTTIKSEKLKKDDINV